MKRRFYSAALNVKGKRCLVIGRDSEADDKSARLRDAGADVTVIDPGPRAADAVTDQFLVILTPKDDAELSKAVAARCRKGRVLLAALDQPDLCDVIHVSEVRQGALSVAISTDGVAPGLARKIRQGLDRSFTEAPLGKFLEHLRSLRERLERDEPDVRKRKAAMLAAVEDFEVSVSLTFPKGWK